MTETNGDDTSAVKPENAPNTRDRENQILQQVLTILAEPPPTEQDNSNQLCEKNLQLRNALSSMASLLRDKTGQCLTLERKVSALAVQVSSLKEVVAITKDLLNIRDMEVKHLNQDITNIEAKIDDERQRHNAMLGKMDQASKIHLQLKEEYETQLKIFQELKEKYERRAELQEAEKGGEGESI